MSREGTNSIEAARSLSSLFPDRRNRKMSNERKFSLSLSLNDVLNSSSSYIIDILPLNARTIYLLFKTCLIEVILSSKRNSGNNLLEKNILLVLIGSYEGVQLVYIFFANTLFFVGYDKFSSCLLIVRGFDRTC